MLLLLLPLGVPLTGAADITVMTWNLHNLYDTRDDPDTKDETWLPAQQKLRDYQAHWSRCEKQPSRYIRECMNLDWSAQVLQQKIDNLAKVINSAGPVDIIALQEVENQRVLNQLADALEVDYPTRVLIPGRDRRGINVALISRLALRGEPQRHPSGARGILQVDLEGNIHVLVVHFASPLSKANKRTYAWTRLQLAAEKLPGTVVAMGDFNIKSAEEKKIWQPQRLYADAWQRAAEVCENCTGTYYYRKGKDWSMLDRIFLRKGSSLRVCDAKVIRSNQKKPQGFRLNKKTKKYTGTSDHWPLYARLCN